MRKIAALAAAALMAGGLLAGSAQAAEVSVDYISELTGEPIQASLASQRPVAIIVDNESIAYPHYGTAEGDVVYELINSTANGHITRLMILYKDWENITQVGSIRSVRPTNILLAAEWNAVLCHDGGPFYVDQYFARDYAREHFSGTFSRVDNGKPTEFTEYVLAGDLDRNFDASGYSRYYNEYAPAETTHFYFADYGTEVDMNAQGNAFGASEIELPFEHTESALKYNTETGTYDYYCYGDIHKDEEDGQVMTFENVLIQECTYTELDENGYMIYNCIDSSRPGYYISNGYAQPITWTKDSETGLTRYYDASGNELRINCGKTYITLVPDDKWSSLVIR